MFRKVLDCPVCGDVWKRVYFESLLRLGPSTRECRACMHVFTSGEKEWMSMSYGVRLGYFAQNALKLVPLALLFGASVVVSIFMSMVPADDLAEYARMVALALVACFLVLSVWSSLLVLLSIRRSKRRRRFGSTPWVNYRQHLRANQNFISDAAWQRERGNSYVRYEVDEEEAAESFVTGRKMAPASVRLTAYSNEQVEALA